MVSLLYNFRPNSTRPAVIYENPYPTRPVCRPVPMDVWLVACMQCTCITFTLAFRSAAGCLAAVSALYLTLRGDGNMSCVSSRMQLNSTPWIGAVLLHLITAMMALVRWPAPIHGFSWLICTYQFEVCPLLFIVPTGGWDDTDSHICQYIWYDFRAFSCSCYLYCGDRWYTR